MRVIFVYLTCCHAMLLFYGNGTVTCDGNEISIPNTTFCNTYALGTSKWVYNSTHFLQSKLEIIAYHKTALGEEFVVTTNKTHYYINDVYVRDLILVIPGYLIFDYTANVLILRGINTVTAQILGFVQLTRNFAIAGLLVPAPFSDPIALYMDGQTAMVLARKDSVYSIYRATVGTIRFLINTTDTVVIFNRTTLNITLIPVVVGVVNYCNIECSNLAELINSTNWVSNINTSTEPSTTEYATSINSSTITDDTSILATVSSYISSVLPTTKWFDTSTSASSPSTQTTTTIRSSSTYSSSKPDQLIITVWSTQEIHRVGFTPLNITGQFVIPDQSILRLDLSEVDFSVGDSIVLFTFSSHQGSFSGLELLDYSSCLELGAHLEESETQLTLVFTTSSVVCAGTIKQIM